MLNLKQETSKTQRELKLNDKVKFIKDGVPIKYGIAVEVGDWGCKIYNPKNKFFDNGQDYDVLPDSAEWYPYKSFDGGKLDGGVIMI